MRDLMKGSDIIFGVMASTNINEYSIHELKQLCSIFNISESQLRTNLSRMRAGGLLEAKRKGKRAYYSFAGRGISLKENVAAGFGSLDWSDWDQKWWGVSFSVPELEKPERHRIRIKLAAYRFVSLNPGFWVRPLNRAEKLEQSLESVFSNKHCCVINFDFHNGISREEVAKLWNLDDVNKDFLRGLEMIKESRKAVPGFSPEEAFREKIITGEKIVSILFKDPLLPEIYLPLNWAAKKLKKEFVFWNREISEISNILFKNLEQGGD